MGRDYYLKTKEFFVGDIAADSDAIKIPLWLIPEAIKITQVRFGVDTAITAQDTNYNKVALTDITNDIAEITTGPASGGDSLAAGVFLAAPDGLVAAQVERAAGDQLQLEFTKTGSGLAMSNLVVQVDYYSINP